MMDLRVFFRFAFLLALSCFFWSCTKPVSEGSIGSEASLPERDVVFQTSTINALLEGVYDGNMTFGDLKKRGDFGIGTVHQLDGEMIALDGSYYQIKSDGNSYALADSMTTPFASVTFFDADTTFSIDAPMSVAQIYSYIDSLLVTSNILYAVKIKGSFSYIRARSVPAQTRPYRPLVQITATQPTFEYQDAEGYLVGFRLPDFVAGINVPGYHMHFLSADKSKGGHLLEATAKQVTVSLDYTSEIRLVLPGSSDYYSLDLSVDKEEELNKVEK